MNNLLPGNCLDVMKTLPENSVDAIVTDPPYGLSFMGKKWDYDVPSQEIWEEALRVLKPGGYLLSFAGTRTQHRMAVRIEDAGFEIRDMIAWVYGSGFPKSLNIGKAVDKINGETGRLLKFVEWYRTTGMKQKETNEIIGKSDVGSHYLRLDQPAIPTRELWAILRPHIKIEIPQWVDDLVERIEREREIVGKTITNKTVYQNIGADNVNGEIDITKGTSEWEGWGTALKPALEPITVARKPLSEKNVAENVLKWGVGGIDIDGSRVGTEKLPEQKAGQAQIGTFERENMITPERFGRFPSNLIHDGSDEVVGLFPMTKSGLMKEGQTRNSKPLFGSDKDNIHETFGDSGSAARFFYCAKASKSERNRGCEGMEEKQKIYRATANGTGEISKNMERFASIQRNNHPTVKPIALMEYLVKLVSREGAVVLDPFMGSGSTGIACRNLKRNFIGIELDPEYLKIAEARINND